MNSALVYCSITVIVMWSDRKVSSTAFLLLNLAITDTLTLLGYWLAPTLRTLDDVFGTNTGKAGASSCGHHFQVLTQ